MPTRVAILGSTGSIGRNALEVIEAAGDVFEVVALTANRSVGRLAEQCRRFRPRVAALGDEEARLAFLADGTSNGIDVLCGLEGIVEIAARPDVDIVLNALVGSRGVLPTLESLRHGKRVALANKEALVMGGDIVMAAARENGGEVVPVDSEHSAIFQVLSGRSEDAIDAVVLTASGGPFRGWSAERMRAITVRDALRHPVWKMGAKITVDSASLVNKGLEVIEAHFLFDIDYDRIEVVIHPQSVVHSLVRFRDGSLIAQLGVPDMKIPIRYALSWPERMPGTGEACDLVALSPLTFEAVPAERFPALEIAYDAGRKGGTAPAAFNAANEISAAAFLEERIGFHRIPEVIERVVSDHPYRPTPDWDDLAAVDRWARRRAEEIVS